jgi:LDH2 family malate/lactate/ureidoglycolate dehydrogenase
MDARRTTDVLLRTTLRGRDSHGVVRLPRYLKSISAGRISPRPRLVRRVRNGVLLFNVSSGFSPLAVSRATDHIARTAANAAVVVALIRTSGNSDALGAYALQLADVGMMAFVLKTTPPLMAMPGSRLAAIGNNPIAFAMPLPDRVPLVFDMAASTVSRSRILAADAAGTAIPLGWAMDAHGVPTTEPGDALHGMLMPIAGHKGIGLAMIAQGLAASLQPAGNDQRGSVGEDIFMLVVNPRLVGGLRAYRASAVTWLSTYLEASGPDARYPGQRAAEYEAERRRNGLPLKGADVRALRRIGRETGILFPEVSM